MKTASYLSLVLQNTHIYNIQLSPRTCFNIEMHISHYTTICDIILWSYNILKITSPTWHGSWRRDSWWRLFWVYMNLVLSSDGLWIYNRHYDGVWVSHQQYSTTYIIAKKYLLSFATNILLCNFPAMMVAWADYY